MVRTLQRRFITAAMAAVTVLLLVLVGAINGLHWVSIRSDESRVLEMLADNGGIPGDLPDGRGDMRTEPPGQHTESGRTGDRAPADTKEENASGRRGFLRVGRFTMDNAMSMRFFVVLFSEDGSVARTDTSHIWSVSADQAAEMASEVRDSGKAAGRSGDFRYLVQENTVVFLDVSEQENTVLTVLLISALIAAVCWLLTGLLVTILSGRAIAPVARNIEKQKEFVTNAGHEIKTPLAIISANAEALELFNGENKWTRNIRTQVTRLNGLMQELLTLSRMDEMRDVRKEATDLTALAAETGRQFTESAAARQVSLRLPGEDDAPVTAMADREMLRQLISILLDNAVKYTPEGGRICLETDTAGGRAVLRQYNTIAPGTREQDPSRLLDRFYRSDKARTQKSGGYGIGLSAARAIAEANGAVLSVSYPDVQNKEQGDQEDRILFTLKF